MALSESTTLDEVNYNAATNTLTVTWRDHIFRDGVEIDEARQARTKTYGAADIQQMISDLGPNADKYKNLLQP